MKNEKKSKKKQLKKEKKDNIIIKLNRYFKEVRYEVKKVTWPKRNEIITSTLVVLVVVLFFTFYIGVLDFVFIQIVKILTYSFGG